MSNKVELLEGYAIRWARYEGPGYFAKEVSGHTGSTLFTKEECVRICDELNKKWPEREHWPEWNSKRLREERDLLVRDRFDRDGWQVGDLQKEAELVD